MEWNEELMSIVQPELAETGLSAAMQERARVMGKWLWIYFWTQIISLIPGVIVALMTAAEVSTKAIEVLGLGFSGVLVVCLFQMGKVQERLRTCAVLNVVVLAATLLEAIITNEFLTGIVSLVSSIVGLMASYQFMHGCADALAGVDREQAEKWVNLWKWYMGLLIALIVCVPLALVLVGLVQNVMIVILVSLAMIALAVTVIVLVIREIVYTCRTAKIFRGIASNL